MAGSGIGVPAVVSWLLVALCGGTALYCAVRACTRGGGAVTRLSDSAETLMGAGMAVMALPLGVDVPLAAWVTVFGATGVASLGGAVAGSGRGHHAYHALGHLAMVYMAVLMARGAMPGMRTGIPLLTAVFLIVFAAHAVHGGLRAATPSGCAGVGQACRVVMSLSMFCMLLALT
jgi:hypothetical protein